MCAKIPDITTEPELYHIVKTNMVHGLCGNTNLNTPSCVNDNKFLKKYPKEFQDETFRNTNGYPLYRRRNNDVKMEIFWLNDTVKYTINNRWIVLYNQHLSNRNKTYIIVEICSLIKV